MAFMQRIFDSREVNLSIPDEPMDSHEVDRDVQRGMTPLTREELKEELHSFAKGYLAQALREAFWDQQSPLVSEACKRIEEKKDDRRSVSFAPGDWMASSEPDKPAIGRKSALAEPHQSLSLRPSFKAQERHVARLSTSMPRESERWSGSATYSALSPVRQSLIGSEFLQAQSEAQSGMQAKLSLLVESSAFEQISGICVILNAILLGYDTNYMATNPGGTPSELTQVTEPLFCIIFLTELLLRVCVFGRSIFYMDGWRWNIMDVVLVSTQCVEQLLILLSTFTDHATTLHKGQPNISVLRVLRLLRIIRIARLLRAFHLFDDLRVIVSSIMSSVTSLGWSICLLMILIYAFSLMFLQSIVSVGPTEHYEEIHYWFSSLFRTFLTMFECVVGGADWDTVVYPIVEDISPLLGLAFCIYIATCLFTMMNLLTGIFVDKAMMSVHEDKDVIFAKRIRDLFLDKSHWEGSPPSDDEITLEHFQQKLDTPTMRDYFYQINVDTSEAPLLFELMDSDGSGTLKSEEIVRACLRLKGPARALELYILMKDMSKVHQEIRSVETELRQLLAHMESSRSSEMSVSQMP